MAVFGNAALQHVLPVNCQHDMVLDLTAHVSASTGIGTFQSRTPDIPYTLIPGDIASSIIVASMAATAAGQGNQEGPNITQACTSCSNPITLRQLTDDICHYYRCYIRYGAGSSVPEYWGVVLCCLLSELAYILTPSVSPQRRSESLLLHALSATMLLWVVQRKLLSSLISRLSPWLAHCFHTELPSAPPPPPPLPLATCSF